MKMLYSFPIKDVDLTEMNDEFLMPNGLWCRIPDDCIGQEIGENVVRRPVVDTMPTDDYSVALDLVKEIRKTAENISKIFGLTHENTV